MFRHLGKNRTYSHNLKLASMLSIVAGIVNVTGVMSIKVLTTNVTGHFAYFSEEVVLQNYPTATIFLLYILFFLLGAFCTGVLIEMFMRKNLAVSYLIPMFIEMIILLLVSLLGFDFWGSHVIACLLLFAMGLQNALVTKVSHSVVRTTHLTGLFTDLGIELSQLIFYRSDMFSYKKIRQSINLKLIIIFCFFSGCLLGGVLYHSLALKTLLIAVLVLLAALYYDYVILRYYHLKRKFKH